MKKTFKVLQSILSGGFLDRPEVRRLYPFFLFLVVVALFWIANTYSAISIQKEIADTKEKLKRETDALKRQETIYTNNSQPSQLIEKLGRDSIKMAHNATHKIIVSKDKGGNDE
jgi:hypothetical protein